MNKWFHHWAHKENVSDPVLLRAADEIVSGKVEAALGGYLFKKRLALPGGGKRGGYRIPVGYRRPNDERIIFLYTFAKNNGADISAGEKAALSLVAESFVSATDAPIQELLAAGSIWEVVS